jgi:hypothetical protein
LTRWGAQLAGHGWTTLEVFGVHYGAAAARRLRGLLAMLSAHHKIEAISGKLVSLRTENGGVLRYTPLAQNPGIVPCGSGDGRTAVLRVEGKPMGRSMTIAGKMASRPDAAFHVKLWAWLAGNPEAKAVWKHRRPDLPDQSMAISDAELRRLASADGSTDPAELERLVEAHHRDWAGEPATATTPAAPPPPPAGILDKSRRRPAPTDDRAEARRHRQATEAATGAVQPANRSTDEGSPRDRCQRSP